MLDLTMQAIQTSLDGLATRRRMIAQNRSKVRVIRTLEESRQFDMSRGADELVV